jgi:predicted esterase
MARRQNVIWGGLIILLFLSALFWAKERNPFSRKWFTLKTADHGSLKCVAVLPKPMRRYPVVIYAHGFGGNLMDDGNNLRQMAELGLATVSLEYDQTNEAAFTSQFETLLRYLGRQKWVKTNAIAWVGFSRGANRMLDFALRHSEQQPQLLVQLSGAGLPAEADRSNTNLLKLQRETMTTRHLAAPKGSDGGLINLHCPILLIHAEQDEVFPIEATKQLATVLQTNGLPVTFKTIPGVYHNLNPEGEVVFRYIGEYCLTHLIGRDAWQNYYSIAQWRAEAPSFWLFCLPAVAWAVGGIAWSRYRKPVPPEKIKLRRYEIALRWLALFLASWAIVLTAVHLITPCFQINDTTLAIARWFLVQPKERGDFEYLVAQPIWAGQKLKTLLEHVELAGYNRELINWQLDDRVYQDYVLSPTIVPSTSDSSHSTSFNWRRPLWEEFYPRIRREHSPEAAAKIVARHLRERVTIVTAPNLPHDVPAIWLHQITDEVGFEIIYVAALRSVGIPARLDSQRRAEFWDGTIWKIAQPPSFWA